MKINKGFTLIEMIVTIVIVAILASMAVPMFRQTLSSMQVKTAAYELQRTFSEARSQAATLRQDVWVIPVNATGDWNNKATPYANAPDRLNMSSAKSTELQTAEASWFVAVPASTTATIYPFWVSVAPNVRIIPDAASLESVQGGIAFNSTGGARGLSNNVDLNGNTAVTFTLCDLAYPDSGYVLSITRISSNATLTKTNNAGCA